MGRNRKVKRLLAVILAVIILAVAGTGCGGISASNYPVEIPAEAKIESYSNENIFGLKSVCSFQEDGRWTLILEFQKDNPEFTKEMFEELLADEKNYFLGEDDKSIQDYSITEDKASLFTVIHYSSEEEATVVLLYESRIPYRHYHITLGDDLKLLVDYYYVQDGDRWGTRRVFQEYDSATGSWKDAETVFFEDEVGLD